VTHWPFIAAAYAIALGGTFALAARSYAALRRAERDAEALRGER
jgi:hypothetical protein